MVYLIHFLFSVRVNIYFTSQRIFSCLGELPAEGLPLVVGIPQNAFALQRSVPSVS